MNKQIGFIGAGKMGQAMISGIIASGKILTGQLKVSTSSEGSLQQVTEKFGIRGSLDNTEIARFSDILFIAVHPADYSNVISEIKHDIKDDVIIITIAGGITIKSIEEDFDKKVKVVRTMPNTPSLVREGMTALTINSEITEADLENVYVLLNSFGKTELLPEELMDAVPAVSGSSPAYVYMFIEALADGAVRDGISRSQAYQMAAQAVLGAAKMVLETDKHPAELKDDVCTPGGSTIQAVTALEENGFRSSVLKGMEACTNKNKRIEK
jgi:pyrroline-5-carboxylate reductase